MRHDRSTPSIKSVNGARTIAFLAVGLTALVASWSGCGGGDTTNPTGTGASSNVTTSDTGGPTGSGGAGGMTGTGGAGGMTGTGGSGGSMGCTATEKLCNGMCVSIDDPQYGCDPQGCTPCAVQNGTPVCSGGTCGIGSCDAGFDNCDGDPTNGCEVDTSADPNHCGGCGAACVMPNGTAGCNAGQCVISACDTGFFDCNNDPVDGCEGKPDVDPQNCGQCGNACPQFQTCEMGVCGVYCPTGKANCDNDASNGCETTLETIQDCAFCGDACNLAHATPDCVKGVCEIVMCDQGYTDCDNMPANGCETHTDGSVLDCGACGNVCPSGPHSTPTCTTGTCGIVCDAGWADCNGDPADGCEQETSMDTNNCGGCGITCSVSNGTPACMGGVCVIASCNPGFADCDAQYPTGCEVDNKSDTGNCGVCGNTCSAPNGTPSCSNGMCTISSCNPGYANCNNQTIDGCEINTDTSLGNCGACGSACSVQNGTPVCSGGMCNIGSCNAGFGDCNSSPTDGCETNTQTNTQNCGTCGNTCSVANGTPACMGGACGIAMCNAGWADCDGNVQNGCEINTQTSVNNCGGCGNTCTVPNGTPSCTGGACAIGGCNPGWADCDGNVANGCETNTQTSVNNCGACGNACSVANGTPACSTGTCTVASCNAGFDDCNKQYGDGCEVNIGADTKNCGGCGIQCFVANGTPACTAGMCMVGSCTAPYANCDGQYGNGCETNVNTDNNNCGACGNSCSATCTGQVTSTACSTGSCVVTGCNGGYYNVDNICGNGCECQTTGTSASCAAPTALGTVNLGQALSYSGNLVPLGQVAYLTVTFTGNTSTTYHPRVRFASNPGNEFQFDILTDCTGGTMACGNEGGQSLAKTDWEVYKPASNGYNTVIPAVGAGGKIIIRVFRKAGAGVTCNNYTLSITN